MGDSIDRDAVLAFINSDHEMSLNELRDGIRAIPAEPTTPRACERCGVDLVRYHETDWICPASKCAARHAKLRAEGSVAAELMAARHLLGTNPSAGIGDWEALFLRTIAALRESEAARARTQHWLDEFQSAAAAETVKKLEAEKRAADEHAFFVELCSELGHGDVVPYEKALADVRSWKGELKAAHDAIPETDVEKGPLLSERVKMLVQQVASLTRECETWSRAFEEASEKLDVGVSPDMRASVLTKIDRLVATAKATTTGATAAEVTRLRAFEDRMTALAKRLGMPEGARCGTKEVGDFFDGFCGELERAAKEAQARAAPSAIVPREAISAKVMQIGSLDDGNGSPITGALLRCSIPNLQRLGKSLYKTVYIVEPEAFEATKEASR
jgi:hypothetical protein